MRKEKFLYWEYYIPEKRTEYPIIFGFFDIGDYKDKYIFVHINSKISFNIQNDEMLEELSQYFYPISKLEEDMLLDDMGENGKRQYREILKLNRMDNDYKIFSFAITPESIYLLTRIFKINPKTIARNINNEEEEK